MMAFLRHGSEPILLGVAGPLDERADVGDDAALALDVAQLGVGRGRRQAAVEEHALEVAERQLALRALEAGVERAAEVESASAAGRDSSNQPQPW